MQKSIEKPTSPAAPAGAQSAWKATFFLWGFALFKVPLILYLKPTVVRLDGETAEIKVKLKRRSKNHLNSMYFGALAIGADVAGGLVAMHAIHLEKQAMAPVFKSVQAEFLRRPEADVHFTCRDGAAVREMVRRAAASGERETMPIRINATTPVLSGDDPVATFELQLSVKLKKGAKSPASI